MLSLFACTRSRGWKSMSEENHEIRICVYKLLKHNNIKGWLCCRAFRLISSNFGDVVQILEICTTVFKFAPRTFRGKDMATVTAFIRVSTKKTKEANVRFRLRDGRAVQLLYSSDITVKPEHWNPKKEELKERSWWTRLNARTSIEKWLSVNSRLLICTMPLRTSLYLLQSGFQQKCINFWIR